MPIPGIEHPSLAGFSNQLDYKDRLKIRFTNLYTRFLLTSKRRTVLEAAKFGRVIRCNGAVVRSGTYRSF